MRFLYVNKILSVTDHSIVGEKTFDAGEPLRQPAPWRVSSGDEDLLGAVVAPGAVSEAIGQLASWCALKKNDFNGRPVFMFADRIEFFRQVKTREKILLKAQIEKVDANSLVFSGTAEGASGVICRIDSCHCHLVSLDEMENPEVIRARFERLITSGEEYGSGKEFLVAPVLRDAKYDRALARLTAEAQFQSDSFFYQDHFPRRPVTPIIMLNEAIGELTKLACDDMNASAGSLLPRQVEGLKIRNFVLPDEVFELEVDLREKASTPDGNIQLSTTVQVRKAGRPILRGQYSYEWRHG